MQVVGATADVMANPRYPKDRSAVLQGPATKDVAFLAIAVGLISLSLLLFEMCMVRLFSVILSYHFVFLAVSVALLGLGVGGALGHAFRDSVDTTDWRILLALTGLTALALPTVTLLMVRPPWGARWPVYGLLAALPFVSAGMLLALIYRRFVPTSGLLYGADLVGASAGCLLSVPTLWYLDAITAMFSTGLFALVGAAALALGTHRMRASLVCGVAALLFGAAIAADLRFGPLDIPLAATYDLGMKTMFAALRNPLGPARILETRWTPLARTDLVQYVDPTVRAIFTDAGAGTVMLRFDGDWAKLAPLQHDTGFLPLAVGPRQHVLLIGPGGGKDVLLALMGGAREITAVEVNPATVAFVREHGSFTGGIYDRPDVHVVVAEGRSFVRRTPDRYDMVYLSLVFTQASEAVGYSLVENFIYTIESFQDYLDHLRPGGWLAMVLHDDAALSKALTTGLVALRHRGIPYSDLVRQVAVIRQPNRPGEDPRATRYPLLVLKAEPFTRDETMALARETEALGLDPLFIPGVVERGLIPQLLRSPAALAEFEARAPYNVQPATDDSPFFYNTDPGVPRSLQWLLWATLVVLLISLTLPIARERASVASAVWAPRLLIASYFALIGTGYTLAEVALLQKFVLFLGWPTLTLAIGLTALLISSGIGSFLTQRWSAPVLVPRVQAAILMAALILLTHPVVLPVVTRALLGFPLPARALVTAALLFPIGLPLGMSLPLGLRLAGILAPERIPSLWAVNGVASVLGSVLAVVLALSIGFNAALVAAGLVYGGVIFLVARLSARVLRLPEPALPKGGRR